jgi:hypothetical protein
MSNETFGKLCGVAAVVVLILGFVVIPENPNGRKAFMIECQSDGLKHYQCVSLWNGGGLAVFRGRDMPPVGMN